MPTTTPIYHDLIRLLGQIIHLLNEDNFIILFKRNQQYFIDALNNYINNYYKSNIIKIINFKSTEILQQILNNSTDKQLEIILKTLTDDPLNKVLEELKKNNKLNIISSFEQNALLEIIPKLPDETLKIILDSCPKKEIIQAFSSDQLKKILDNLTKSQIQMLSDKQINELSADNIIKIYHMLSHEQKTNIHKDKKPSFIRQIVKTITKKPIDKCVKTT